MTMKKRDHRTLRKELHQRRPDLPYRGQGGILSMKRDELLAALKSGSARRQAPSLANAPDVLLPGQVQALLQISRATFFRMVKRGDMPGAVKIGGSWRVMRDALRRWLEKCGT